VHGRVRRCVFAPTGRESSGPGVQWDAGSPAGEGRGPRAGHYRGFRMEKVIFTGLLAVAPEPATTVTV
jgi:hypothetical protein